MQQYGRKSERVNDSRQYADDLIALARDYGHMREHLTQIGLTKQLYLAQR